MDDIVRPPRPTITPSDSPAPSGHVSIPITSDDAPEVDIAGVAPRRPAPPAVAVHIPETSDVADTPSGSSTSKPLSLGDLDLDAPSSTSESAAPAPEESFQMPSQNFSTLDAASESEPTPTVEPTPVTEPAPTPESTPVASPEPSPEPAPTSAPASSPAPSLLAEIEAQEARETDAKVTQAPATPAGKKSHVMVIIVGVIIALGLIAGAGYAYWQNKKETATPTTNTTKTTTTTEKTKDPATADDIDTASKDIETSLTKSDETKDYQATDLSDTTLGL